MEILLALVMGMIGLALVGGAVALWVADAIAFPHMPWWGHVLLVPGGLFVLFMGLLYMTAILDEF